MIRDLLQCTWETWVQILMLLTYMMVICQMERERRPNFNIGAVQYRSIISLSIIAKLPNTCHKFLRILTISILFLVCLLGEKEESLKSTRLALSVSFNYEVSFILFSSESGCGYQDHSANHVENHFLITTLYIIYAFYRSRISSKNIRNLQPVSLLFEKSVMIFKQTWIIYFSEVFGE